MLFCVTVLCTKIHICYCIYTKIKSIQMNSSEKVFASTYKMYSSCFSVPHQLRKDQHEITNTKNRREHKKCIKIQRKKKKDEEKL